MAAHGDDFTFTGLEEVLFWMRDLMKSWFEIKVRAMLGPDARDDKEVVILGRRVTYGKDRIEYEADRKHRENILEHFGMGKGTRALSTNGEKDPKKEEGDEVDLEKEESIIYRGLAARLNFLV